MKIQLTAALAGLGISLVLAQQEARAANVNVFLLAGQSNMSGRAVGSNFPSALQNPVSNVQMYNGFTSGGLQGSLGSVVINTSETGQTGPEVSFASSLRDTYPTAPFALIKYAEGGTSLASDWAAGGNSTTVGDGTEYTRFQTTVTNGLNALQAANPGDTFTIAGFLWTQGERDVVIGETAAEYQANLTAFIGDVRDTYGDIPFLYSRLSDAQTGVGNSSNIPSIQAGQDAVAANVSDTYLINTNDFGLKNDDLHFNALGQEDLGNAFAAAAIASGAIPEPSTVLLSAFAGLGILRRRRN